jgi:hypothetical protein
MTPTVRFALIVFSALFVFPMMEDANVTAEPRAGSSMASPQSGSSDIYAAVEQSLVDKVVKDAAYPLTLVDQWWPFDGSNAKAKDRYFSADDVKDQLEKAKKIDCSDKAKKSALACRIQQADVAAHDSVREQIARIRANKAKVGAKWKGPSDADLDSLEKQSFPIKLHLAHLKVNLLKAPDVKISGISTAVNGVSIDVDAIGEVWVLLPQWVCTKTCSIGPIVFCCEGHFESQWGKILEVDVNDVKITADGTVTLAVENLIVYGVPSLSNLALDYDVLRDINLAPIANDVLGGKRLTVIDARDLVAALPYVNTKYRIKKDGISISGNGEIRAEITVEKVP